MVFFVLIAITVQVSLTMRALGLVCSFLGFGFVSVGNGLARVGVLCRDASTARHESPIEDSPRLHDGEGLGAPIWFYDVKPGLASSTPMLVTEGQKWYTVRKGREVGIFDTWETCKSHVHGYSRSEFKSFRNLNNARTYLL